MAPFCKLTGTDYCICVDRILNPCTEEDGFKQCFESITGPDPMCMGEENPPEGLTSEQKEEWKVKHAKVITEFEKIRKSRIERA